MHCNDCLLRLAVLHLADSHYNAEYNQLRGGQTTACGQKIARKHFLIFPSNFFCVLHFSNHIQKYAKFEFDMV